MGEETPIVSMEDLCRDTMEMACRYHDRTATSSAKMALLDFLPLDDGRWVARALPVTDTVEPVFVPDERGAKETMRDAVVVLNHWLVVALASPIYKDPPKA